MLKNREIELIKRIEQKANRAQMVHTNPVEIGLNDLFALLALIYKLIELATKEPK